MSNSASEATSIKGLFQSLIIDKIKPLQGKVKSASPLIIQAENDEKLLLEGSDLIVPNHLTDYTVNVDIEGVVTGAAMTVYNALKAGETVHLLSLNKGKLYYILDRVV